MSSSWTDNVKKPNTFLGQEIPEIDAKGLRQFGYMFAGIVSVLFGLLLPFLFGYGYPLWPWILAVAFVLPSLIYPRLLGPVYQIWMRFGVIMNIIMSRVILGTVFLLTVVPAGLIFRLRGKDILDLKLDENSESYRKDVSSDTPNNLKKPY